MAGKPVVLVLRDRPLASWHFRDLNGRECGAFLVSLCLLARNDASPGAARLFALRRGRERTRCSRALGLTTL